MNRLTAALRPFRKPALALVAAAGLGAWGGGAGALQAPRPGATPVPGRAGIAAFEHIETAALTSPAGSGLAAAGGERPQSRSPGERDAGSKAAGPAPALPAPAPDAAARAIPVFPAPAAALYAAAPRAPPSFPS